MSAAARSAPALPMSAAFTLRLGRSGQTSHQLPVWIGDALQEIKSAWGKSRPFISRTQSNLNPCPAQQEAAFGAGRKIAAFIHCFPFFLRQLELWLHAPADSKIPETFDKRPHRVPDKKPRALIGQVALDTGLETKTRGKCYQESGEDFFRGIQLEALKTSHKGRKSFSAILSYH